MMGVMEFMEQLKSLGIYQPDMDILDIGCDNGWLFTRLNKPGRNFDLIDRVDNLGPEIKNAPNVRFFQTSLLEFVPDRKYDLVFARNVFFQTPHQIEEAARYAKCLKPGGVMCVSFLGENDPWARKDAEGASYYSVSKNEVSRFAESHEVLWFNEFQEELPRMDGTLKFWHWYQVIIKKS